MKSKSFVPQGDAYRAFDNILSPDPRGVALFQGIDLEGWQKYVDRYFRIEEEIPSDVNAQLATIKNLFLYSWFVYRFSIVAKTQLYNTLELSLKLKFQQEGGCAPQGLRGKLEKALKEGWVEIEGIPSPDMRGRIEAMAGLRNSLNHGSTMLMDPLTLLHDAKLQLDVIHSLFQR